MSKMFFKICVGILALAGFIWPSYAAVQGRTTLFGHVPSIVSQVASMGRLSGNTNLHLAIGLPLHNQAELDTLLEQLNDPASTNFQKYLNPEEFVARFGPTEQEYQAVVNFAQTNGFTVTKTYGNRMLVDVTAKVSDVEHTFQVNMRTYHHPTESRDFYAPDTEPSVDSSVRVLSIQGINNYFKPHSMLKRPASLGGNPGNGSGPSGGYIGKDFRNAYVPGTTLNGSGQIVGLLQFDGYLASDIVAYESLAGLTNVPLVNVLIDGFNGSAGVNNDEVCLDIETSIAMAPALASVVVFEADIFANPNDILSSMAASNTIKQFSASWGYGTDPTTGQLYQQLAVQGQTFLNCSGDGDAWVGSIPYGSCESPYITIVGGTTLTMSGNGLAYVSEKAWNWGFIGNYNWNPDGYFGSSGGISTTVPIPTWQQGINMTTNHGSLTKRNVPDISLTADNVFVVSSGGSQGSFGGTSCASPLLAGFMALVNQQAVLNGKPSVGFLAPRVYAVAKTTNYASAFHDTILGDNTWDQSLTNFFAVPGYDLCTGLGTPNGTNFINALVGNSAPVSSGPIISAPRAPWGTTLGVMNGGNPNGAWFLFVQDDKPLDVGVISNGWSVALTSANPVGFASDNQLIVSPALANVNLGGSWTMTFSITNYGPSIATNVLVTDDMPIGAGLAFVGAVPSVGSLSQFGSTLLWNIPTLAINASAQLNISFNASVLGTYTNSATVSGAGDPNPDDDTAIAMANVSVFTPAAFSSVTFSGGVPTISVTNAGAPMSVIIQANTNLANPFSWLPIYTNTTPFSFTDLNATNYPYRFYRSLLGP